MKILYDDKTDLLYLRFDEKKQEVRNKRVADNVIFDLGNGGKIAGIEILDASKSVDLRNLLPIEYDSSLKVHKFQNSRVGKSREF